MTSIKSAFNSVNAVNTGVFQINESLDNNYVFTSIEAVRALLNYEPARVSALELILEEDASVDEVRNSVGNLFGETVVIKDRFQLNDALYKMLNTENLAVYLIFTLVLIIALFNVIGSIIMMILDKKKNLNTLFNLGVSIKDIRKIFFLQGSLMSVLGGLSGLLLGFILVALQKLFGWVLITPTLPYPVSIKPLNFLIVFLTIAVLGILSSRIAATRISTNLVKTNS